MSACFFFPVIIMFSFMPVFLGSELRLPAEDIHGFRVKRGWIWNQLLVEEEDPTPKIIGQVKPEKKKMGRRFSQKMYYL